MNVLLTGASGFIGSHLARALRAAEYVVIEARRDVGDGTAAVRADFTRDLSVRDWLPKLAGIDAVINAVGILREHGAQTFERIHKRAPQALFTACVAAGVRRIVQISALGADRGMTRYFLSKRAADDYLATLPLEWTIVRPAMVFGPGGIERTVVRRSSRICRSCRCRAAASSACSRSTSTISPKPWCACSAMRRRSRSRIELVGPQSLQLARAARVAARRDASGSAALPADTDAARARRRARRRRERDVAAGQRDVVDAGSGYARRSGRDPVAARPASLDRLRP